MNHGMSRSQRSVMTTANAHRASRMIAALCATLFVIGSGSDTYADVGPNGKASVSRSQRPSSTASESKAARDESADQGYAVDYPHIVWLIDRGDLTAVSRQGRRYLDSAAAQLRIRRTYPQLDFAVFVPSGYVEDVAAGIGQDAIQYADTYDAGGDDGHRADDPLVERSALKGSVAMAHDPAWWADAGVEHTRRSLVKTFGRHWFSKASMVRRDVRLGQDAWNGPGGDDGCFDIDSILGGCVGDEQRFALLDLFLMGLAPKAEVPPYDFVDGDGRRVPVTVDEIVRRNGAPEPPFPEAQHAFAFAFVIITPGGRSPASRHLEIVDGWREQLPQWWAFATDYRSTLTSDLVDGRNGDGTLEEPCDDGNRQTAADFDAVCLVEPPSFRVDGWTIGALLAALVAIGAVRHARSIGHTIPVTRSPFVAHQGHIV